MKATRTGMSMAIAVVVLAAAAWIPVAHATITDDINPQNQFVFVTLSNHDPSPDRGLVEVVADLGNGKTATAVEPYDLAAGEKGWVAVEFESTVVEVISVGIIEDPDPIPTLR